MTMVTILSEEGPVAFATLVSHDLGISAFKAAPKIVITQISPTRISPNGFFLRGQFDLYIQDKGLTFVQCKVTALLSDPTELLAVDVIDESGNSVLP